MGKQILEGILVLDFTSNVAGPTGTALLADQGAEIIKIERPVIGDECRNFGPKVGKGSICHCWCNRGKHSVTIDLADPEGVAIIHEMIKKADIIVESNRPGVMQKLGLDYESVLPLNPEIVYCAVSAFGQTGPLSREPGYDLIAQAMSGLMYITGEKDGPPMKSGVALGDFFGGLNVYSAVMTALYHKKMTGEGQFVDVSLLQGLIWLNNTIDRMNVGEVQGRTGNHHAYLSPYGLYQGKDGQSIIIAAVTQAMWHSVCKLIGRPELIEDPRFADLQLRCANQAVSIRLIEEWLCTFDRIEDAVDLLKQNNIPSCKVCSAEDVVNDPHVQANGWLVDCETADDIEGMRTYRARGPNATYSKTPGVIRKAETLGQSNDEVLTRFGCPPEKVRALQEKWAAK